MKKTLAICLALIFVISAASAAFADGETVITFTGTDRNGNKVDESIFKDCKLILFNRWEPWCHFCREEMPYIEELYEQYKDDGFLVVAAYTYSDVNENTLGKTADEILDDAGCTFPNILLDDDVNPFDAEGMPYSFYLNGDGEILPLNPAVVSEYYSEEAIESDVTAMKEWLDSFVEDYNNGVYDEYLDNPDALNEINVYLAICASEDAKSDYLRSYRDESEETIAEMLERFEINEIPGAMPKEMYEDFIKDLL